MIRVLMVCHGNICRSPIAQFVFQKLVDDQGLHDMFVVDSAATSTEELGCDMYPKAKRKLREKGIPFSKHCARQIQKEEYSNWDYIFLMDRNNMRNITRILPDDFEHKIHMLLENQDVADPWYTQDFETAYLDILKGCQLWLKRMLADQGFVEKK